jgi:hypothetical protein
MFDDQPKNQGVPGNLPVEPPPDMFAGIEAEHGTPPAQNFPKALDSGLLKKKSDLPQTSHQETNILQTARSESHSPVTGRILFGIIVLLLVGGLGVGGWWLFNYFKNRPSSPVDSIVEKTDQNKVAVNSEEDAKSETQTQPQANEEQQPTQATSTEEVKATNENILFGDAKDTDMDDLTDADESKFKTDPNKPDTDGDGIIDGDEIKIWKTDPLKKDTDGDKYSDADEIKNGYNPLGDGKFANIPMAIIRIVSSTASQKIPPVFDVVTVKLQK